MKLATGIVKEIFEDGSARIDCPPELIPTPGQYLLAHAAASSAPIADSVFFSHSSADGFIAAAPMSSLWAPGTSLHLRGPLGRGFILPSAARKLALFAFDISPARLLGLIPSALKQNAEVALLSDKSPRDLPEVVEVQPLKAAHEIFRWADYVAIDTARENLNQLLEMFERQKEQARAWVEPQILIHTQMPCGALAECGVCAITSRHRSKLICKDGPVFNWKELI